MRQRLQGWASFLVGAVAIGSAAVTFLAEDASPGDPSIQARVLTAVVIGLLASALTWTLTGVALRSRGPLGRDAKTLLRSSQLNLGEVIELLPEATLVIDAEGLLVAWNQAMAQLTGVPAAAVLGKDYRAYSVPFYGAPTRLLAQVLLEGGTLPERFADVRRHDSAVTCSVFAFMLGESGAHLSVTARVLVGTDGRVAGAIESIRDVTDRFRAEEALRESDERMRGVFQNAAVGAVLMSPLGTFQETNQRWAEMLGYQPAELVGMPLSAVTHPEHTGQDSDLFRELERSHSHAIRTERRYVRKDGTTIWTDTSFSALRDSHGQLRNVIGVMADITDRRQAEEELRDLTKRDPLTGLANRRAFEERLQVEWRRAARVGASVSLLMVDVDRFKDYNDVNGHVAGDECLIALAQLLTATFQRATDFCARWGGEEFAVVLGDTGEEEALRAGERVRARMEGLGIARDAQRTGVVTVSVGVASTRPNPSEHESDLVLAADAALYEAKRAGRNLVRAGAVLP